MGLNKSVNLLIESVDQLPREVLAIAFQLRDSLKNVYVALYLLKKPATAQEVADKTGHARAYDCMRLNQLCDMGLVKQTSQGQNKVYTVNIKSEV